MSLTPTHVFTSTLNDNLQISNYNMYKTILTAILFFAVLSWFNFALALYTTFTTTDPEHKDETIPTLGFALIWSIFAIIAYLMLTNLGFLAPRQSTKDLPLLRGDVVDSGDYVGRIDFSAL